MQVRPLALRASIAGATRPAGEYVGEASLTEQFFALCVLVLSTTAFVNLFPGELGVEYEEQGKLFAQILWSTLYILMFFFARKRITELVRLMWQDKVLVALLGWACISVVWSIDRQVTIRHFVALLATTLFGVYFAVRYPLRDQLRLLTATLGIVISASVFACLAFPSYAITVADLSEGPSWQGVVAHRNTLGRLAVLAAVILALHFLERVRRTTIFLAIVFLFLVVILTQSKTAVVYFVLGIAAFPFARAFHRNSVRRKKILVLALLAFCGLTVLAYYNWEQFTYSLGRDPALTGRFALWVLSMTWIADKPFLGYGFDAFWSNYYGPAADFRIASGWLAAPHAHNGFINLWLDLGLIGVLLFVLGFIITYREAVSFAKITKSVEGIWPVTFLTFFIVYSFTETSFLSRNDLLWILYLAVMFSLRIGIAQRLQLLNCD